MSDKAVPWAHKPWPPGYSATPDNPDAEPEIDAAKLDRKVGMVIAGFQQVLADVAAKEGLTFEECARVTQMLVDAAVDDPHFTSLHLQQFSLLAFGKDVDPDMQLDATPADAEGPVYYPGAPEIPNPGKLPMRSDEPGTPLFVSGRVLTTDGQPLSDVEVDIWLAAANGHYSNTGVGGLPDWTLRGIQRTDANGQYAFQAILPVPYYMPVRPWIFDRAFEAQGFSLYRARHLHFKFRHPGLRSEVTTQLYFQGDPYLRYNPISHGKRALVERLTIDPELHADPAELMARGLDRPFMTATYDFKLALVNALVR